MLPKIHRLTSSKDFQNITKNGFRVNTDIAVIYAVSKTENKNSQIGLIVSKTVGNSVYRHRVSRLLRNSIKNNLTTIPITFQIVIRALPKINEYSFSQIDETISTGITKLITKANV
jgi:ribonuclease P protein component